MTGFRVLQMSALASAAATGGALGVIRDVRPEGAGPAPHLHREHDEGFYVVEGRFEFLRDDRRFQTGAGEIRLHPPPLSPLLPSPVEFSAPSKSFIRPGGLEESFRDVDALLAEGMTSYEATARLAGRHDYLPNPDRSLVERPLSHIEKSRPSGRFTLRAFRVWVCSNWKACTEGLYVPTAELTA